MKIQSENPALLALVLVVLALAGFLSQARQTQSGSPVFPRIEVLAERDGNVEGIAASADGSIYLTFHDEPDVFRLDPGSGKLVKIWTTEWPRSIAVDAKGGLHVAYSADPGYGDVWEAVVGKVTPSGIVEQIRPRSRINGLAADGDGSIYAAAAKVWKLDADGGKTMITGADLDLDPQGVAVNGRGQILITDSSHTVYLLDQGKLMQLAGKRGECSMVDGAGEAARFCGPTAAVADRDGNFLVVDRDCAVRKVTTTG